MYWLLAPNEQAKVRGAVTRLVEALSLISGNPQDDQLFPYVGRKDKRKARAVVEQLSPGDGVVVESFVGSGVIAYAIAETGRAFVGNEWEPYAHRMASAPWRLPDVEELRAALQKLYRSVTPRFNELYWTVCECGEPHVIDSLFFDREPLRYTNVTHHERLGRGGRNITYRGAYKCPHCRRQEKHFDRRDAGHLRQLAREPEPQIFQTRLIENSRINLPAAFTRYGDLFPHRSKLALDTLWSAIGRIRCSAECRLFLEDVFLSILPQAKYKDYRSKSQDLHCPPVQLREVNLLYRFKQQAEKRLEGLRAYSFSLAPGSSRTKPPIECKDFRDFLSALPDARAHLILTDPPWTDGNAYFEKAQLYHPWMSYNLATDKQRLEKEFVVTDAPSRRDLHDVERWWADLGEFFRHSYRIVKPGGYVALFFRPIPAPKWLTNVNRLKLTARQAGFEPLLAIDVESSDPSMRVQQSASYLFSMDMIMLFLRLPPEISRVFHGDIDIDQIAYQTAYALQEEGRGPITKRLWRIEMEAALNEAGAHALNAPASEDVLLGLFLRYCDEVAPGEFLTKPDAPFAGQLFDVPAVERLFTYVPHVIKELTREKDEFTYGEFLLALATFVENGTRMLISQIQRLNIRQILRPYATPLTGGRFRLRRLPALPRAIASVMEFDPYEFEGFIATLLSRQGYTEVVVVGRSSDRGVDIQARDSEGRLVVVQCKRWISNVGSTPIQRLHSFAVTRGAARTICITTSDFTRDAIEEASHTGTRLINGGSLARLISQFVPDQVAQGASVAELRRRPRNPEGNA